MPQKKLNIKPEAWVLLAGIIVFIAVWAFYLYMPAKTPTTPQNDFFAVHGCDLYMGTGPEIFYYLKIPNSMSLFDRMQLLADKISRFQFGRRPITIVRIEVRQNKKIAIIDLRDLEVPLTEHGTWYNAFQGSSQGGATETTLTKSFLQKEYQGEWIDGVEFLYNGEPFFNNQWAHMQLEGTMMRDGTIFLRDGTVEHIPL